MFAAVFWAENGCELTFSLRRLVLLFVVAVGDAVPFSPGGAAESSGVVHSGVAELLEGGDVQILGSGVALHGWRIRASWVGSMVLGGCVCAASCRRSVFHKGSRCTVALQGEWFVVRAVSPAC
jgi:hypothetical protein